MLSSLPAPCISESCINRGGSRTAATSKMDHFVIIGNGFQPLTIITKCSILDVAAVLYPPLIKIKINLNFYFQISLWCLDRPLLKPIEKSQRSVNIKALIIFYYFRYREGLKGLKKTLGRNGLTL